MSIRLIVTAGYGNGTFNGTVADVVLMGYTVGETIPLRLPLTEKIVSATAALPPASPAISSPTAVSLAPDRPEPLFKYIMKSLL